MRHTHTFIIAKLSCKPPGDLLWRPVQLQLLCHQAGQLRVFGQVALLGPQPSIPSTLIRDMSSVPPPSQCIARNLATDARGSSTKAPRDLADRSVSAKPTRNLLSLRKSQGTSRAMPPCGRTTLRHVSAFLCIPLDICASVSPAFQRSHI